MSDSEDDDTSPPGVRHTALDDVVGILTGCFVAALGLYLLRSCQAVTGGTAGLSLLLGYATPVPFELVFVLVNLPFAALGVWQKGWDFTLRSMTSIVLVAVLASLHARYLGPVQPPTAYGVVAGNALAGVGLLILFRHRASLGGFGVLALIAQERFGLRAGWVMLGLDALVLLAAFAVAEPLVVAISAVGVLVLNLTLALNHRPGRYLGA